MRIDLSERLSNGLISSTRVVCLAVGEQPIDDNADNREEEDQHTPEDLVGNWAIGFEDLDCGLRVSVQALMAEWGTGRE